LLLLLLLLLLVVSEPRADWCLSIHVRLMELLLRVEETTCCEFCWLWRGRLAVVLATRHGSTLAIFW